ncbi:MAG TPA: hypothetical protein VGR35_23255 [Tepidisphaeraceae bacterium]|nr:hypothetical protein [Tepidisphaeraceae bacterium]
MITILPDGGRSRYSEALSVRVLSQPPDFSQRQWDGFQPGTFQNQEAFVRTGSSGKYDNYSVVTRRGGVWYEISLAIPEGSTAPIPSPEWQQYINTFDAGGLAPATTQRSGEAA